MTRYRTVCKEEGASGKVIRRDQVEDADESRALGGRLSGAARALALRLVGLVDGFGQLAGVSLEAGYEESPLAVLSGDDGAWSVGTSRGGLGVAAARASRGA